MSQVIARGDVTDHVLTALRGTNFLVGDVNPPDVPASPALQAGWNGTAGAPGSTFNPYGILSPLPANLTSGPIADPQADIQLPYQLSISGITRQQVEKLADLFRNSLLALTNTNFTAGTSTYYVQQVWFSVLGGVSRADQTDPATLTEVDVFTLWMTR